MNVLKFLFIILISSLLNACASMKPSSESTDFEHLKTLQEYEQNKPKTPHIEEGEINQTKVPIINEGGINKPRPPSTSKNPITHGVIGKPSLSSNEKARLPTHIRAYFGTNRNVKDSNNKIHFGQKNAPISYGFLDVSIPPKGRHSIGVIERPSIFKFEFRENPNKHIVIRNTQILNKDQFFIDLNSNIRSTKGKNAFIFIHGFNVSFNEAAYRTAQMAYDLEFDGAPIFYSWPSNENILSYFEDQKVAQITKPKLEQFLTDFFEKTDAQNVYLISHSMGGEVLTGAIVPLINKNSNIKTKLKEIILTAPDIDADVFKNEIAPTMTSLQKPITLYVSSGDTALKVSKVLNKSWRLGLSGENIFIHDGIETVDMSTVDTSFLGHSYYGSKIPVLRDLSELMNHAKRARERKLNEISSGNKGIFWRYQDEHLNQNK